MFSCFQKMFSKKIYIRPCSGSHRRQDHGAAVTTAGGCRCHHQRRSRQATAHAAQTGWLLLIIILFLSYNIYMSIKHFDM